MGKTPTLVVGMVFWREVPELPEAAPRCGHRIDAVEVPGQRPQVGQVGDVAMAGVQRVEGRHGGRRGAWRSRWGSKP